MRARFRMLLVAMAAVLAASCSAHAPDTASLQLPPETALPPGAQTLASVAPQRADTSCDPTASIRPGAQPQPGNMPTGSTMAAIVARGNLRVGVDQNEFLFAYRDPATGQIEGFDIDIAREIARDLFGSPDKIELHPIQSAHRIDALKNNEVDIVVDAFTPTCTRRQDIEFSTVYFTTDQRILATKGSGINSAADLAGKTVCGLLGSTTLDAVFALPQRPKVIGMANWLDCLSAMQQGQIDAVSTDLPTLYGLAAQDPNLQVVGGPMAPDYYGVGVQKQATDMVQFVNGVLDRIRTDGTWQRIYNSRLGVLGPAPAPPAPRYRE
ncbi:glutamate ABC transporter substrate-binding protein [Nocardia sp. NPDC088792]|uniref:glutamate ABC transporter substrate-binding protein n=1 Tax=Nocardia sp. NPDC088792 TaxID=3364332 RepID=UPI00382DAB2D